MDRSVDAVIFDVDGILVRSMEKNTEARLPFWRKRK